MRTPTSRLPVTVTVALFLAGCGEAKEGAQATRESAVSDAQFAAVQERGAQAMGVDQYTSTHHFTPTDDGGLIELQRDTVDGGGITQIRTHMREIAMAFKAGDFTIPGMVHAVAVPGTDVMKAKQDVITYTAEDLPRGAQVRIRSSDSAAVTAVHSFLAFQRQDHHAGMRH